MMSNKGPVAKLYLSIIDDVIESMREVFQDEGLEDRVLDDLKNLWETKMLQSKAMEGFQTNINSSNFVLQLPVGYRQADREFSGNVVAGNASVVIPPGQHLNYQVKNNQRTIATFALPAGLSCPVQIPAGVTLQQLLVPHEYLFMKTFTRLFNCLDLSGQLYKVNVPVLVTQALTGHQPRSANQSKQPESKDAPSSQPVQQSKPQEAPAPSQTDTGETPETSPPLQQPPVLQEESQPETCAEAITVLDDQEPSPEPLDLTILPAPSSQNLDFQISSEEHLASDDQFKNIDELLNEVIEVEREKAARAKSCSESEDILGLVPDFNYSDLSDIIQLDGPGDDSNVKDGELLEENDFLGMINAEAIRALEDGDSSGSDAKSLTSSDGEAAEELAGEEDEDPLNSGDDVIEQDIPDLFDTENVIVCQYDKIHRSKNRWKFHLKDGVISYRGRDYVFSKAVGEAEW
ncbi:LOW QUALITY PROTEIN: TFIIA-alpha and beta-like factor [Synchiropus splendidus]|uniref:LOW QUALITY PROTEIN: TFIIA-alpha and beta-like factor n=1 Tax=Synchiropus splendidus TaxID=270530 RepID=UPI00237E3D95|nr:LOW QUALITY PROTEIN: TFIIA-alpha and beta-like factor [Synchiropus splendidus]